MRLKRRDKIKKVSIIILITTVILNFISILKCEVYAANIGISASSSSVYVGNQFSVTISGINGKVIVSGTDNISLSQSGTLWITETITINCTAKTTGKGTVTVTPVDVTTSSADPVEITNPASVSVNISEKPAETKPATSPEQTTPSTPSTNNNQSNNSGSNSKPSTQKPTTTTTTNKKTNTQTNKTQTEVQNQETIIPEEATPQLGIYGLTIKGIKENGEEVDVNLTPAFTVDVFEYSAEVENEIIDLKIIADAGEYSDLLKIEKPEKLVEGENEIVLNIQNETDNFTYKVKLTRKQSPISEENNIEPIDTKMNVGLPTITMPVWSFILIIFAIIIIEAIILKWKWIISKIKKY